MVKFISKHLQERKPSIKAYSYTPQTQTVNKETVIEKGQESVPLSMAEAKSKEEPKIDEKKTVKKRKNKLQESKSTMNTAEKVAMAQEILGNGAAAENNLKILKRDRGLIERTESSKTILTEDNKELLID